MIEVLLAKALICFASQCHPVLVGHRTPVGVFQVEERSTDLPGYGGSVLQFLETKSAAYVIHRVYPYDRRVNRAEVLKNGSPAARRMVTKGCVNVDSAVYEQLVQYVKTDPQISIK